MVGLVDSTLKSSVQHDLQQLQLRLERQQEPDQHDNQPPHARIPSGFRPNATSLALTWDFENKMTTAGIGNNSSVDVTYKRDVLGHRVYRDDGTSGYVYVQVGQQTIADYGGGMAPASPKYNYVYACYQSAM